METTRRLFLRILPASGVLARIFAGSSARSSVEQRLDVDRLLDAFNASARGVLSRRYVASATVTLFSVPIASRNSVGSGFAEIEEGSVGERPAVSIRFGAGSYPESARGLNRLGFIHEGVVESRPGFPEESAYFAFMTTSQEKSLDQAKKALEAAGKEIPYTAAQGHGARGAFVSRVDRIDFPAICTFRDLHSLTPKVRDAVVASATPARTAQGDAATFLYCVHRAMLNPKPQTSADFFFNSKQFQLQTTKAPDAAMANRFAERGATSRPAEVVRLNGMLTEHLTGTKTPFRVWYEAGSEGAPPLRFEYQAKSFLRLAFEAEAIPRS